MPYVFNPFTGALDWTVAPILTNQTPVETPNGTRTLFTLPNSDVYATGTLQVWLNGMLQRNPNDYTETSTSTITFVAAPLTSDIIQLSYRTN